MPTILERSVTGTEPLTVAQARDFARISSTADDAIVEALITAARSLAEDMSGRTLTTAATWKLYLDGFPSGDLYLPMPPVTAVSSVSYEDTAGSTQTWNSANYQTDFKSEPARLCYIEGGSYPATQGSTFNTVTVTYTAGYTTCPDRYALGIRMLVAYWYDQRIPVAGASDPRIPIPFNIASLLRGDRVWGIEQ